MRLLLNIVLICLLLITQGCIGFSVISKKELGVNYPNFKVNQERLSYQDIHLQSLAASAPFPSHYAKYTKNDVLKMWGKPEKEEEKNDKSYWIYKREIGFSGVILGAIIPVPLLVPVGYRNTIMVFKDNQLETIVREAGRHTYGFNCLLL